MRALCLPICLWVENRRESQVSSHYLHQCPPKVTSPARVSVRYYLAWNPKIPDYAVEEQLSSLHGPQLAISHLARSEAHQLGQPVHTGEDGIKSIHQRQMSHKVNAPAAEPLLRYLQGM